MLVSLSLHSVSTTSFAATNVPRFSENAKYTVFISAHTVGCFPMNHGSTQTRIRPCRVSVFVGMCAYQRTRENTLYLRANYCLWVCKTDVDSRSRSIIIRRMLFVMECALTLVHTFCGHRYPGFVKNTERAISTLGGWDVLGSAFSQDAKTLEMRIEPGEGRYVF